MYTRMPIATGATTTIARVLLTTVVVCSVFVRPSPPAATAAAEPLPLMYGELLGAFADPRFLDELAAANDEAGAAANGTGSAGEQRWWTRPTRAALSAEETRCVHQFNASLHAIVAGELWALRSE